MTSWLDTAYEWCLRVNGNQVTDYLISNSLRATLYEGGSIGTLAFELEDTSNALEIVEWQEVTLATAASPFATKIWGGYAVTVTPDLAPGGGHRRWSVRCETWETILNRGDPVRGAWINYKPGSIVKALFTAAGISDFDLTTYVSEGTEIDFFSNGEKLTEAIDRLALEVGFMWRISADKYFIFGAQNTELVDAPAFQIAALAIADFSTTFPPLSLSIQRDASDIVNSVTVRGGTMPSDPYTDTFVTNGVDERWQFTYRPVYDVLTVMFDGAEVAFGIDGFDPPGSFAWLVNLTLGYIRSTTGAPVTSKSLVVTYRYDTVVTGTAEDAGSIAYYGRTFHATVNNPTIHNEDDADALAAAIVAEKAYGIMDLTAEVDRIGVYPTQIWTPNFPVLGLNGVTVYTVRQVTIEIDRKTSFVRCQVKAGQRAPKLVEKIESRSNQHVSAYMEYGLRSRKDWTASSTAMSAVLYYVRTVTASYTVTALDVVIICNKATAMTVTLPAATGSGRLYVIGSIGAGAVTVDANGSETIDGATTQTLLQYDTIQVIDYGSGTWKVI